MVGADQLTFETMASFAIDDITINLTITINHTILAREVFVLGMDMESVGLLICGSQLATQIFIIHPKP